MDRIVQLSFIVAKFGGFISSVLLFYMHRQDDFYHLFYSNLKLVWLFMLSKFGESG